MGPTCNEIVSVPIRKGLDSSAFDSDRVTEHAHLKELEEGRETAHRRKRPTTCAGF
jgi:hypothetical protein